MRRVHYRRSASPVSLADCLVLAACPPGGRVVSSDVALLRAAQAEGLGVVALPDSAGNPPTLS